METFGFNDDLKDATTDRLTIESIDDGIAFLRILQDA